MTTSPLLAGKTALITGAASGIGAAAAPVFAAHGAAVIVADIDADGGEQVAESITKNGGRALFVRADVTSAADVAAMVRAAVTAFGSLDCAFNNAGVVQPPTLLHETTEDSWHQIIDVNLRGVWLCLQHQLEHMSRNGGGAIVNTASVAGLVGVATPFQAAYTASKHAVIGLTRAAALEYATRGIRVNAICPGGVRTPMIDGLIQQGFITDADMANHPMGRFATPQEVGEAAAWLCSDASSFTTGHALTVDGGWTAQ